MNTISKIFLLLVSISIVNLPAKEKNRFERIVARYPHLSVFLATAGGAAAGVYLYKKFDKPATQANAQKDIKSLFDTQASLASSTSLKAAAIAGTLVGTAIAAAADCGMPRFVPASTQRRALDA